MQRTPELVERAIVQAVTAGISSNEVARQFDVGNTTVRQMVARNGDLAEVTRELHGDYLSAGFKYLWLSALDRARTEKDVSSQDLKNFALAAAISLDKLALIQGWPTQVIAHLHEHRHQVGEIAEKLAGVARKLEAGPTREAGEPV